MKVYHTQNRDLPFYFLLKRKTEGLFYDLLKKLDLAHPI